MGLNIDDIRLTPEEIRLAIYPEYAKYNKIVRVHPQDQAIANTATDKAMRCILDEMTVAIANSNTYPERLEALVLLHNDLEK